MKSLRISTNNISYLTNILSKFQKEKSKGLASITWIIVWYLGFSILLLLSLHSYYMGFSK